MTTRPATVSRRLARLLRRIERNQLRAEIIRRVSRLRNRAHLQRILTAVRDVPTA